MPHTSPHPQELQQKPHDAKSRLQQVDNLHTLLLQHMVQGVFCVEADGRVRFINPAAENIIGYASDSVAGTKLHPLIHHHYRNGNEYPECKCPLYLTLKDGKTRHINDELFWCADGTPIDVDYVVAAIKVDDKITGAIVLFNDTTLARKQQALLEQRELSLAQAQSLAQLGSWRFDVEQQSLEYSDECYRILGWPSGT